MYSDDRITPPRQIAPSDGAVDSIGGRIRAARKTLDLNQEALAARLGVTQPTVANWEADVHNPRQLMLAKLAEALSVSLGWLAGGDGAERSPLPLVGSGYVARGLFHVPVIPAHKLLRRADLTEEGLHAAAVDYIPISARSGLHYAVFLDPAPYEEAFPGETLFVFDVLRARPFPGVFGLIAGADAPRLHLWPAQDGPASNHESDEEVLGALAITVRFF